MGKTFNTINIKPDINSFVATSLTNSGSSIDPSNDYTDPTFLAGKNSGEYNSFAKKGSFYADLTDILNADDGFGGSSQDNTEFSQMAIAFIPHLIFNQDIAEYDGGLTVFSTTDNTNIPLSGFSFANTYATLLPFNIKLEGLIFDNRAKAVGNAAYTFTTQEFLQTVSNITTTNTIPNPEVVAGNLCEITLTAIGPNGGLVIPNAPPLGQSPFTYNFVPGDVIEVRVANTNPALPPNTPTPNGFNAQVTAFNQNTRELTFIADSNTVIGNWGGAHRWVITNQTNNDDTYIVNAALDNIVHFETQYAAYPIHYSQTGVYPDPPEHPYLGFTTSGNNIQFSTPNGDYVSQLTYRKFWSPGITDINNPNGISLYGNLFNHIFSVDAFGGGKTNGFNLNLEHRYAGGTNIPNNRAGYSLSGGFRRESSIIVRGAYNMY